MNLFIFIIMARLVFAVAKKFLKYCFNTKTHNICTNNGSNFVLLTEELL